MIEIKDKRSGATDRFDNIEHAIYQIALWEHWDVIPASSANDEALTDEERAILASGAEWVASKDSTYPEGYSARGLFDQLLAESGCKEVE